MHEAMSLQAYIKVIILKIIYILYKIYCYFSLISVHPLAEERRFTGLEWREKMSNVLFLDELLLWVHQGEDVLGH